MDSFLLGVCWPWLLCQITDDFVHIIPKTKYLEIILDVALANINDPKGLGEEIVPASLFDIERTRLKLTSLDQMDDVLVLIRQSFVGHLEVKDE